MLHWRYKEWTFVSLSLITNKRSASRLAVCLVFLVWEVWWIPLLDDFVFVLSFVHILHLQIRNPFVIEIENRNWKWENHKKILHTSRLHKKKTGHVVQRPLTNGPSESLQVNWVPFQSTSLSLQFLNKSYKETTNNIFLQWIRIINNYKVFFLFFFLKFKFLFENVGSSFRSFVY